LKDELRLQKDLWTTAAATAKMKFGRNLARNIVPEWSGSYINYKGLKRLIKSAIEAGKLGEEPDLAGKASCPLIMPRHHHLSLRTRRLLTMFVLG
jgi:hypothetical protein